MVTTLNTYHNEKAYAIQCVTLKTTPMLVQNLDLDSFHYLSEKGELKKLDIEKFDRREMNPIVFVGDIESMLGWYELDEYDLESYGITVNGNSVIINKVHSITTDGKDVIIENNDMLCSSFDFSDAVEEYMYEFENIERYMSRDW